MPFNISPSSYQGGNFLFAGLSGVGKGIGDAIEKAQEQSKLESYNDSIVQHAYQNGQVDLEQLTKYRQMGHTQKTGYAASLAANFAEDMKRQQLQAAQEERAAQAQLRQQQAAAFNWKPDEAAQQLAQATGNALVPTGPGKYQVAPYSGSGRDAVVTDPLTIDGKVIPGIGVNRLTGQYVHFGEDTQTVDSDQVGNPILSKDKSMFRSGNTWKPITEAMRKSIDDFEERQKAATEAATKTQAAAQPGLLQRMFGGGQPAATPQPAAVAPAGSATGNDVAKVKVKSPDGKIGYIPAAQLEAALRQGYTRAQ